MYPKEIYSSLTNRKTLGITAELGWDETKPLTQAGWSRFEFTIIDRSNDTKKITVGNIPAPEEPVLYDKYKNAMQAELLKSFFSASAGTSSSELIEALNDGPRVGPDKGKTFGTLIKANPGYFEKRKDFLIKGIDKFENNRLEMKSINIIESYSEAEINEAMKSSSTPAPKSYVLYESVIKPLMSRKDSDGNHLCYKICISYVPEQNYPFVISIENGWCPVTRMGSGQLQMEFSKMCKKTVNSFVLGEYEGIKMINCLHNKNISFENSGYALQKKKSDKLFFDQREAAKTK